MFARFLGVFCFFYLFLMILSGDVLATYNPGDTLNPTCLPTDSGCDVVAPITVNSIATSGGLEVGDSGLGFIPCADGQFIKYVAGVGWTCTPLYTASSGIQIVDSDIRLNLNEANTWVGGQTFGGGINATDTLTVGSGAALNVLGSASIKDVRLYGGFSIGAGVTGVSGQVLGSDGASGLAWVNVLSLGNSNTWTGLQTFNGGWAIGNTAVTTNSDRLNYLSGISSTNGSLIIGVGSSLGNLSIGTSNQVLLSNGTSPVWMTIAGLGQTYSVSTGLASPSTGTFALDLGSSNVWTATQTFNGGIGISGDFISNGVMAFKKGNDYSTVGTSNDVNFGNTSLVRLTGASAQTITGIVGADGNQPKDGQYLTIINAGTYGAVLSNQSVGSTEPNRIITGTEADITIAPNSTTTLIYDATATRWRIIGNINSDEYGINIGISDTATNVSTTFADVEGGSFSLPTAGTWLVEYNVTSKNGTSGSSVFFQITDSLNNVVNNSVSSFMTNGGAINEVTQNVFIGVTGAATYKLRWKVDANTGTIYNNATEGSSKIIWTKVANSTSTGAFTTNWSIMSDVALKKDIVDLDSSILDKVLLLRPVTYEWNVEGTTASKVGFIAQEVEQVGLNDVVIRPENNNGYYGLDYSHFAPYLVKSIQEQQQMINTNEAIIEDLGSAIDKLNNNLKTTLVVSNLIVDGAATFGSYVDFEGPVVFRKLSEFIDKTIFKDEVEFQKKFCMLKSDGNRICVTSDQMEKLINSLNKEVQASTETPTPTLIPTSMPTLILTPTPTLIPTSIPLPTPTLTNMQLLMSNETPTETPTLIPTATLTETPTPIE